MLCTKPRYWGSDNRLCSDDARYGTLDRYGLRGISWKRGLPKNLQVFRSFSVIPKPNGHGAKHCCMEGKVVPQVPSVAGGSARSMERSHLPSGRGRARPGEAFTGRGGSPTPETSACVRARRCRRHGRRAHSLRRQGTDSASGGSTHQTPFASRVNGPRQDELRRGGRERI